MPLLSAEWLATHKTDGKALPKPIRVMRAMYGGRDDRECGQCAHLVAHRKSKTYYKCNLTNITFGAGTDWRKSWPACRKFEEAKHGGEQ